MRVRQQTQLARRDPFRGGLTCSHMMWSLGTRRKVRLGSLDRVTGGAKKVKPFPEEVPRQAKRRWILAVIDMKSGVSLGKPDARVRSDLKRGGKDARKAAQGERRVKAGKKDPRPKNLSQEIIERGVNVCVGQDRVVAPLGQRNRPGSSSIPRQNNYSIEYMSERGGAPAHCASVQRAPRRKQAKTKKSLGKGLLESCNGNPRVLIKRTHLEGGCRIGAGKVGMRC